jgi:hypothetical protein
MLGFATLHYSRYLKKVTLVGELESVGTFQDAFKPIFSKVKENAKQHNPRETENPWQFNEEQRQRYETWNLKPDDFLFGKAADIYSEICDLRNDINHGGFNDNATPYTRITARVQNLFKEIKQLCQTLCYENGDITIKELEQKE